MDIWLTSTPKNEDCNSGYVSINDDGFISERKLYISDDDGNMVTLKNEQIGELYRAIKPALAG